MKDHTILKSKLTKESQITTKDIISLGLSQYDIKVYVENNILTKVSRGLYYYRPSLIEEKEEKVEEVVAEIKEEQPTISQEEIGNMISNATTLMIKKELDKAIAEFEEIQKIDCSNQYTRFSIFACYMFKKDFQTAYNKLVELYENRKDNELLFNIYNYMLLLQEIVTIDERLLNDIANIIATDGSNVKKPKANSYLYKLSKAIRSGDWENAIKFASINVNIDKNQKKYRLTNQCYKYLVIAVIKDKNLVFEKKQEEPLQPVEYEEESIILVPTSKPEQTIKQNLLLEAINNNDYQTALKILEQENVDNPLEIIKELLNKLSSIQSLITIKTPVKVIATEQVRVVDENQMIIPSFEEPEKTTKQEEKKEETTKTLQLEEEPKDSKELIDIAYKAYKVFLRNQNFQEAQRNLQRYEYLCNQNGIQRNIKYHYHRIEILKQDYTDNPTRYIEKQKLFDQILQTKRKKSYEEALSLIAEYKQLGGLVHPMIPVLEAEIYIMLNDLYQAEQILSTVKNNEEPEYFSAKARVLYEQRKFEECVLMCISYNDRRPSTSASNYIMLSKCYKYLQKPSKALKALRKAEEINKANNFIKDLSSEIYVLENQIEYKKEQRHSLTPKKK